MSKLFFVKNMEFTVTKPGKTTSRTLFQIATSYTVPLTDRFFHMFSYHYRGTIELEEIDENKNEELSGFLYKICLKRYNEGLDIESYKFFGKKNDKWLAIDGFKLISCYKEITHVLAVKCKLNFY